MEACLFLVIILAHELGHLFFLLLFKKEIASITLTAIGGIIELKPKKDCFKKDLLINIGGIFINLIILIVLRTNYLSNPYLKVIKQYNQIMLSFNLLPIYPLDGYRILASLLGLLYEDEYLDEVLFYISLLGITILSIISYLAKSIGLGLILIFLLYKTIKIRQNANLKQIKKYLDFKRHLFNR